MVRNWINTTSQHFGCLLETRVKESKVRKISMSVFSDWSFMSNYEFSHLGRIWIIWRSSVRLTPVYKSGQMITCSVLLEGSENNFFCSFVYASNSVEEMKSLWGDICDHHDSPLFKNKPWIIMGDFNEILDCEEHSGYSIHCRIYLKV